MSFLHIEALANPAFPVIAVDGSNDDSLPWCDGYHCGTDSVE